jgi:amidase
LPISRLDATDLARLIRLGRASAREAAESCLSRLRAVNLAVNAVVRVLEEETLSAARAADGAQARGEALGPLHGVPVTTNHGQHKRADHYDREKGRR